MEAYLFEILKAFLVNTDIRGVILPLKERLGLKINHINKLYTCLDYINKWFESRLEDNMYENY